MNRVYIYTLNVGGTTGFGLFMVALFWLLPPEYKSHDPGGIVAWLAICAFIGVVFGRMTELDGP